jgi:gliding motility-associated-like protein
VVEICDDGFPLPNACANDTIFIVIQGSTLVANAGSDQEVCGVLASLNAVAAVAPETGSWTVLNGAAQVLEPNNPQSAVSGLTLGENSFIWTISSGSQSVSDTVTIVSLQAADAAFAGEDQQVCGAETTLSGNIPGAGTTTWSQVSGTGTISDPSSPNVLLSNLAEGANTFVYQIQLGTCSSSDTVIVQAYLPTAFSLMNDTSICPSNDAFAIIGIPNDLEGSWEVLSGSGIFSQDNQLNTTVSGLTAGENVLVFEISSGPCSWADTLRLTVLSEQDALCSEEELFIPGGFSPDDDGANDKFVIYGADGKKIVIKVFNRWGNLVYESDNYLNDWDGTCTTGWILVGDRLPEGTYYYLVQIEGETETRKGYLTLWR